MPGVFPNLPVSENFYNRFELVKQFESKRKDIMTTLKKLTSFPYTIRGDKEALEHFIEKNGLTNVLWEAVPHIRRIFGSDTQFYLELSDDPDGDFREIFIVIKTSYEIEKSLQQLDRLDQEWFLSIVNKIGNTLNITVAGYNEF